MNRSNLVLPDPARRAVVFDLDGTLVDSVADIAATMNVILARLGCPGHALATYLDYVGEGVERLAARALPPEREALRPHVVAAFRALYVERMLDRSRPYPGVPELLDALVARAVPFAVLSNKPHAATVRMVKALLGRWPFVAVLGERPGIPRKPDPAGALEIARAAALPPEAFLFVGDTATDVLTARAAGMTPVGVLWGFRSRTELEEHGAAALIAEPLDLLELLP